MSKKGTTFRIAISDLIIVTRFQKIYLKKKLDLKSYQSILNFVILTFGERVMPSQNKAICIRGHHNWGLITLM